MPCQFDIPITKTIDKNQPDVLVYLDSSHANGYVLSGTHSLLLSNNLLNNKDSRALVDILLNSLERDFLSESVYPKLNSGSS